MSKSVVNIFCGTHASKTIGQVLDTAEGAVLRVRLDQATVTGRQPKQDPITESIPLDEGICSDDGLLIGIVCARCNLPRALRIADLCALVSRYRETASVQRLTV